MRRGQLDSRARDGLGDALGSGVLEAEAVPWGDSAATWQVTLQDGVVVAARRFLGPDLVSRSQQIALVMDRLAGAGVPIPSPVTMVAGDDDAWLVTPWVDGEPGSRWLDTPERAIHLADAMGRLLGLLGTVDVGRDDPRSDPPPATMFAHGDFAPINVLVDLEGDIVALLDLEHAGPGAPGSDAAWWGWVVRHHHPDAWAASWSTFLAAAGLATDAATQAHLHRLALHQLSTRLDDATDGPTRERWRERLAIAATW